eukprot:TRINITY_DN4872_c0_g1_i1.p1 TRINITY_DN4872_c0_g1~~TRINITY_DN4872_c0_g1_i1.p1  ORF type:complete len:523 (-),score=71.67 TRINITY_DN4872_c0_g1_i1:308-1876(-)
MAVTKETSRTNPRDTVLTRNQIETLIAEGRKIVIVDGKVLKVDAWLPYHPGGTKAILHMVGRDATNEVRAFHSSETQETMMKYQIGRIQGHWIDFVPPIQGGVFRKNADDLTETEGVDCTPISIQKVDQNGPSTGEERTEQEKQYDLDTYPSLDSATQNDIIKKYQRLDQRIRDEGLYDCNYTAYLIESIRYLTLCLLSYYFLAQEYYIISAIFLGMFWHQLVFTVHDAGHMGITHDFQTDSIIGMFISNFIGGLSCCWWKQNHNVHHIVTNSAEHDPDIQHMPFFAITQRFFESISSSYYERVMEYDALAKFTLKYQHYLYYPILTFGRFNLYALSWQYIFLGQGPRKGPAWWHRYFEAVGQFFFWFWFGYLLVYQSIPTFTSRLLFVLVSHAMTMPVHVQITLSHFAMSTADLGVAESFPQKMLRTTMDVECPEWLDFFHGGLQFQAIHHLYPRIPRHNLRKCQKLVMEFCDDVGIPYTKYCFIEGNGKVISRLGDIANQARIMAQCQKSISVQDVLVGH